MSNKRILRLIVKNIKGIKDLDLDPGDNSIVVIGGANGQGKSTVLDSIIYGLAGKKAMPPKPIRDGEDKAEIIMELNDIIITRKLTEQKETLTVESKDGSVRYASPQAMLGKLYGPIAFDPLDFARMSGTAAGRKEQAKLVMEMAGLDFTEIDARRLKVFESRMGVNRDLKTARAKLEGKVRTENVPTAEVSVTDIADELKTARAHNDERRRAASFVSAAQEQSEKSDATVIELEQLLLKAKQNKGNCNKAFDAAHKAFLELAPAIDEDPISKRLEDSDGINKKIRENKTIDILGAEVVDFQRDSNKLTKELDTIDAAKVGMITAAKLPVDGLGFDDDGLTFNGLPFSQACASEQLKLSVKMGMSMNPELRVMLIDQGSELDLDNLALLADMALEAEAQVWLTRVSQGEECMVIMEDGEVKK